MKYLSGDFIALYNSAMSQYREEQQAIDEKFDSIIGELVKRERERLEKVAALPFSSGDKVETPDGRIGTVVKCPVDLDVMNYDWRYFEPVESVGLNRYFQLKNEADENVVTCEGMIRKVEVEFEASEIEKDWGKDRVVHTVYPDELSLVKKA